MGSLQHQVVFFFISQDHSCDKSNFAEKNYGSFGGSQSSVCKASVELCSNIISVEYPSQHIHTQAWPGNVRHNFAKSSGNIRPPLPHPSLKKRKRKENLIKLHIQFDTIFPPDLISPEILVKLQRNCPSRLSYIHVYNQAKGCVEVGT